MRERLPILIPLSCTVALMLSMGEDAAAAVIAVAIEGPVRLELHDEPGPCLAGARLAVWTDGKARVPGCWRVDTAAGRVSVAWLDGDASVVDVRVFREPEQL
jgi:hypothetical protein